MSPEALTSSGGFTVPIRLGVDASEFVCSVQRAMRSLPSFSAVRGGIDFRPPHVRWAIQREREMRALTKMWDWPSPPP